MKEQKLIVKCAKLSSTQRMMCTVTQIGVITQWDQKYAHCKKELVSKSELSRHEKGCHGPEGQSIATVVTNGSVDKTYSNSTWKNVNR